MARTRSTTLTRSDSDTDSASNSYSRGSAQNWGANTSQSATGSTSTAQGYDQFGKPLGGWTLTAGYADSSGTGTSWGASASQGSGETYGSAHTTGSSRGRGTADTTGSARSTAKAYSQSLAETHGTTDTANWSLGGSATNTVSEQYTHGRSQTYRSVFEVRPGQAYTLEELVHLASVRIANLRQGECIVKIGRRPSTRIKTLRVVDGWARPAHIARITAELAAETPYITPLPPAIEEKRVPIVRLVPPPNEPAMPTVPTGPKAVEDEWG